MALQAEHALASRDVNTNEWSARYAASLREQLAHLAPNLDVSIESDRIGLTISGAGWAIHAVDGEANGERYLSLMAMRGMHTSAFEHAIRDLCLAMDASQQRLDPERMIGD